MTSMARSVTSSVWAAVLRKDLPSPVAPESDEEGTGEKEKAKDAKTDDKKAEEKKPPEPVKIDFEGLDQRIVALPIDRANYAALEAGTEGILFLVTNPTVLTDEDYTDLEDLPPQSVVRFDIKTRKTEKSWRSSTGAAPSMEA